MYLDRLMNDGKALDWGICGVGVMPGDARMRDVLDAQDCLYTLVEKSPDGSREARVIGSIVEYLFAPDDPEAVIEKMADPAIRIVSLTVTEGGYNFHPVTGEFEADDPGVRARPASRARRRRRRSAWSPRRSTGVGSAASRRSPCMSCDNIQGNGDVARRSFTAFARLRDPKLGEWVEQEVRFPNCMVDRITPVTTDDDRASSARAVRRRGRLAGGVRAVHPVGARGRLRPRAGRRWRTSGCRSSTTSSRTS